MKACGVAVARPQGKSWAPTPSTGTSVNVGTTSGSPYPPASQVGGGQAHRRLTAPRWGGGSVVVRGRESRPHGEGTQRVRSEGLACQEVAGEHRRAMARRSKRPGQGYWESRPSCTNGRPTAPNRRFCDLFNLVCDPAFLLVAWRRVRGNGAPLGRRGRQCQHVETVSARRGISPCCEPTSRPEGSGRCPCGNG